MNFATLSVSIKHTKHALLLHSSKASPKANRYVQQLIVCHLDHILCAAFPHRPYGLVDEQGGISLFYFSLISRSLKLFLCFSS